MRARSSASSSSASVAPGARGEVRADRRVEDVRVLAGERERAPDVVLPELADVAAAERDAALLGIEEAQQQVRDRRLAGAARPDERDPPSRLEPEVEAAQRRRLARRVAGGHALERDGRRQLAARAAARRDRGPPARGRPARARDGRRRACSRARGGRPQRQRRRRTRPARAARASPRAPGRAWRACAATAQHAGDGQPRDQDRQAVGEPGGEPVAAAEAGELVAARAHARERVLLAPVDDELRRAAQQLDELGGELRPGRRLAAPGGAVQRALPAPARRTPASSEPERRGSPRPPGGRPP